LVDRTTARLARRRFLVAALVLTVGVTLGTSRRLHAAATLSIPPAVPAVDRKLIEEVVKQSFASTQQSADAYPVRPEIFEYLLDHPEFASHVTRALKAARYRIWHEQGSLWLDDGWGVRGTFWTVYTQPGLRLMMAQGAYQSALPDIKGRAVVALAYGFQPGPAGRQQVATTVTSFVEIDSGVFRVIGKMGGPLVQRKADREARGLLKVFAKVIRLIEENPADVYARLKARPDVPKPELEEFRKLLGVP
jgi:hypothetical protein